MIWIAVIGLVGWAFAGLAFGMWRGERRARIFIENFQVYGQSNPLQKAVVWEDETPESRVEKTIDQLESIMGTRVGTSDNGKVEYDKDTIENGIEYLLEMAKEDGHQLTKEQAREEVERMLNAEGPDML